jgi:hypothetical protein
MRKLKRTAEEFIAEVKSSRPDVTVMSNYVGVAKPVTLRCECGWEYEQTPHNLLRGRKGCPVCGNTSNTGMTTEVFVEKAYRLHGGYYTYENVVYENARKNVDITCPVHGSFKQTPNSHLAQKSGCSKCGAIRRKDFVGWTYAEWEKSGNKSKNFSGFKLYKVRCYDPVTKEEFINIGKTFVDVAKRLKGIPYEYEVLEVKEGSARFISELEITTQSALSVSTYTPLKPFPGMTECFKTVD